MCSSICSKILHNRLLTIREYHIYNDVWLNFIAEILYCPYDVYSNHCHPFAVGTCS